ncbi:hypothetical protein BDZ97DRAFT_1227819 [Flammula alnicola]|nr:hypothetical protein BDZ97DRAFT_1227819 [Flammula alnicola]
MSTTIRPSLSSVLPNPSIPELPPQLIFVLTNLAYVDVGTLGAIVWDIVSNVSEDYQLVSEFPVGIPTVVYFISRIATLAFFILIAIFATVNVNANDCARVLRGSAWVFTVAMPATTLLFFFRVRAVYMNNKYVTTFFFFVWLGVVAGCFVVASQTDITHSSQPNTRCLDSSVDLVSFVAAATIVPMANDVLIFCAVTWKLMQNTHVKITLKKGTRIILFGHYLPAFSRTLLRDGQAYFLSTVVLAILTTATFCSNSRVGEYSMMLAFPNVAIMHLMGCRIYRKTKLHMHRVSVEESAPSLEPMDFRVGFAEGSRGIGSRGQFPTENREFSTVGGVGSVRNEDLEAKPLGMQSPVAGGVENSA